MMSQDRRSDDRLPTEIFLNAYVEDRPQRGFTVNVSETGLYLASLAIRASPLPLAPLQPLGLEFNLPGFGETIWAAGEICYDSMDNFFQGRGIRFTAMANLHARILHEYCSRARHRQARRGLGTS
jgi:hypothetical protein